MSVPSISLPKLDDERRASVATSPGRSREGSGLPSAAHPEGYSPPPFITNSSWRCRGRLVISPSSQRMESPTFPGGLAPPVASRPAPGNHGGTLRPPQPIMEKTWSTMTRLWVTQ